MNGLEILVEKGKRSIYDGKLYKNCLSRRIWHRLVCFVNEQYVEMRSEIGYITPSFAGFIEDLTENVKDIHSYES